MQYYFERQAINVVQELHMLGTDQWIEQHLIGLDYQLEMEYHKILFKSKNQNNKVKQLKLRRGIQKYYSTTQVHPHVKTLTFGCSKGE